VENKKKFVLEQRSTGRQFNVKAVSIQDAKRKLKKYLADSEEKAYAVFCIAPVGSGYAATTRAADRGEQGKIGLPGGKVDLGEDAVSALYRECEEEGWSVKGISSEPVHTAEVEGKPVAWYSAISADMHGKYDEWFEPFKKMYEGEFLPEPEIKAKDLIAKGIEPGPKMGEMLRHYYIEQLNRDPKFNDSISDNMKVKLMENKKFVPNVACMCLFDSIFGDIPKPFKGVSSKLLTKRVSDDFATAPGSQFEGINMELQNRYDLINKILETVNTVLMSTVIGGPHYTEKFELEGLKPYSLKSSVDEEGKAILRLITEGAPEFVTEGPLNQLDLTDFVNEAFGSVAKGDPEDFDGQ